MKNKEFLLGLIRFGFILLFIIIIVCQKDKKLKKINIHDNYFSQLDSNTHIRIYTNFDYSQDVKIFDNQFFY
jgi:hypothetical protein